MMMMMMVFIYFQRSCFASLNERSLRLLKCASKKTTKKVFEEKSTCNNEMALMSADKYLSFEILLQRGCRKIVIRDGPTITYGNIGILGQTHYFLRKRMFCRPSQIYLEYFQLEYSICSVLDISQSAFVLRYF